MVLIEDIRKEIKSIRIRAQLLQESAARLEEKLAEGVSTPSKKLGENEKQIEQAVTKRKSRIITKSKSYG